MRVTFLTQNKGVTTAIDSRLIGIDLAIKIHAAMIY